MKFKLILHREHEIDTDRDWGGDLSTLYEHLSANGVNAGEEAGPDDIHDAIKSMLADDIEYVVDLSLDDGDFEVHVPPYTTIRVPEDKDVA